MDANEKRLIFSMPDDVHLALKLRVTHDRTTMAKVMRRMVNEYLAENSGETKRKKLKVSVDQSTER